MNSNTMYLIVFLFLNNAFAEESVLCPEDYCKDVTCEDLPAKCQIQNATHNGIFLPPPTTCNCCQYCLENINKGELCSIGNPSNPPPTSICGPGLACKLTAGSEFDGTCQRMETNCTRKQDDYDKRRGAGTVGSMEVRQTCDNEGSFSSYKCIPGQSCYCVNQYGKRLFGESAFTSLPEQNMQCKCSRDYDEAADIIGRELNPHEHFRCAENGDYDTIQCFQDKCLCVDANDGAPSYPGTDLVNITAISKDKLPCYKQKEEGKYFKQCEEEYHKIQKEVDEIEKAGFSMILSFVFPKCDLDGTYQAVQQNSTHKMCVDREGNILNVINVKEDKESVETMNCKCSRALLVITSDEKPICDANGNYYPIQCRRGTCRCVDTDGNQICKTDKCEVPEYQKETLDCLKEKDQ